MTSSRPGVDTDRFHPLDDEERAKARAARAPGDGPAGGQPQPARAPQGHGRADRGAARLAPSRPDLTSPSPAGPRPGRLDRLIAETGAPPVRLLGRVPEADLPGLYGCADVFAMLCRNRWAGLEQEGFGIVFLGTESAAPARPTPVRTAIPAGRLARSPTASRPPRGVTISSTVHTGAGERRRPRRRGLARPGRRRHRADNGEPDDEAFDDGEFDAGEFDDEAPGHEALDDEALDDEAPDEGEPDDEAFDEGAKLRRRGVRRR